MSAAPWTADEETDLLRLVRAGWRDGAIAAHLGRTKGSVNRKRINLTETPAERAVRLAEKRAAGALFRARNTLKARPSRHRAAARVPLWHGRCPAFRPRTSDDANRPTRL